MTWYNPLTWFDAPLPPTPEVEPEPETIPGKLVIISAGFEDDGRLRVEVDYDAEFVDNLRKRGYSGSSDHYVVMQYVGTVYRTMLANREFDEFT